MTTATDQAAEIAGAVGDRAHVAVLARPKHAGLVDELRRRWAGVEVLDVRGSVRELHVRLAALGPFDAVVDLAFDGADDRRERLALHVKQGGVYVERERGPAGARPVGHAQDVDAVAIVREHEVTDVLGADPSRGRLLHTVPGASLASRATVRTSHPLDLNPMPAAYQAPPAVLREWYDAVALPGQAVLSRGLLLPESFSTADGHRQVNPSIRKISPWFAHPPVLDGDPEPLEGDFVHLENVVPGHFGHALTEQISHVWAWHAARRARPGARALVFDPQGRLPGWQTDLLAAAGISADDLYVATGPVRVERLLGSTPMFSRPAYVHPGLATTYDDVGRALEAGAGPADRPAKVFFTRRIGRRSCRNADEVESRFAAAGYRVVLPEEHPLAEQVAMVRAATSVGGFAGSGVFQIAFAGAPKHVVLLTTENYPCHNEYLMSALLGHRLDLVVCRPDLPRPGPTFTRESFQSDFVFDSGREGAFLDDALAE
ncbi:glycosyltransferase 61 family protein [Nocardioides sp.]|uniref:glycosyltransferase family 61 protein n=1 Tax=Nocardioides sp. TaxID=35761 RepID=UPI001A339B0B|nr:glycosyltransferase 61 family protein [Nocardioides sp.]MBJ7356963.1 glycosyltransferase family 61 protein [Nocardioides sp.]